MLGDPALRMPVIPLDIALDVTGLAAAGKPLTVSGLLPKRLEGAPVRIALERPLNSLPCNLESIPTVTAENRAFRAGLIATNQQRANDFVLISANAETVGNAFKTTLTVPDRVPWSSLVLRATATTSTETALGTRLVPVSTTRPPN